MGARLGTIKIKGLPVWVIYKPESGRFATALPSDINVDRQSTLRACFRAPLLPIVNMIYDEIDAEIASTPSIGEMGSQKNLYFHLRDNYKYAQLCMRSVVSNKPVTIIDKACVIKSVIRGSNGFVKLTTQKVVEPNHTEKLQAKIEFVEHFKNGGSANEFERNNSVSSSNSVKPF